MLVDVNVPTYAAGASHSYKEACAWIMAEIAVRRINAAIDAAVIQEILYRYGALQRREIAATVATSLLDLAPTVYPVQEGNARPAVALFSRYAPLGVMVRDLIHVAVMLNNGLARTISTDKHFDRIERIGRIDPQRLYDEARHAPDR
jgi:predicted nucleic acid-binding protein